MKSAPPLPSDPEQLRDMLLALQQENARLQSENAKLQGEKDAADQRLGDAEARVRQLEQMLTAFKRHRFGSRSEKLDPEQYLLALEEIEIELAAAKAALAALRPKDKPTPAPRAPRKRRDIPKHLAEVEQVIDITDKSCACCGGDLHVIGEDVSRRIDRVPASERVIVTKRPRYGCRRCETLVQAPAPAYVVERGLVTNALVAHVAVAKFLDAIPLYRQAKIFARQQIPITTAMLADWMGKVAWWLEPLHKHLLQELRGSDKLYADETVVRVQPPRQSTPQRRGTQVQQFWAYARDDRPWGGSAPPAVAYVHSPDRKGARPREHLAQFEGVLQVDGYAGYNELVRSSGGKVVLAYCWAHLRRHFEAIATSDKCPVAIEVLNRIAAIYRLERLIRGQAPEIRLAMRQQKIKPLVEELKGYLEQRRSSFSAKSKMAAAITYGLSRWEGLCRFLGDGRIEIDSNAVERLIRPIVLTKRAALFAGSEQGAEHWAIIASLLQTAVLAEVEPHRWLTDTLDKLVNGHSNLRLAELMPWNYGKPAQG